MRGRSVIAFISAACSTSSKLARKVAKKEGKVTKRLDLHAAIANPAAQDSHHLGAESLSDVRDRAEGSSSGIANDAPGVLEAPAVPAVPQAEDSPDDAPEGDSDEIGGGNNSSDEDAGATGGAGERRHDEEREVAAVTAAREKNGVALAEASCPLVVTAEEEEPSAVLQAADAINKIRTDNVGETRSRRRQSATNVNTPSRLVSFYEGSASLRCGSRERRKGWKMPTNTAARRVHASASSRRPGSALLLRTRAGSGASIRVKPATHNNPQGGCLRAL